MMLKKYYLAYGSNLNLEQMKQRCPSSRVIGKAKLEGYRLAFKGMCDDFSYLTIEKEAGMSVDVGVFEISLFDEKSLDFYEGYPDNYYKKMMHVEVNGQMVEAMIYIMNPEFEHFMPSQRYFMACFMGFCDFGFDTNTLLDTLWYTEAKESERFDKDILFFRRWNKKKNN